MRSPSVPLPFAVLVRALAVLAVAGIVFFIAMRAVVPSGVLSVSTDLTEPAPFISELKPGERVRTEADATPSHAIIGNPVYVDVTPPSHFDSVTLSLKYTNAGSHMLELGALASALEQQYVLRPAEQPLLDAISWPALHSGELTLYQRHPVYASVDAFLREPPAAAVVAVYRAPTPVSTRIPNYVPSRTRRSFRVSLRGHHRMWTYIKDETLQFTFQVQDMNRQEGADPVILSVYAQDDLQNAVARTVLQDDGNTSDDQRSSPLRALSISVDDLPEGAYQIEFTSSSDVFIREAVTTQRKLVFQDAVYLGDHVGYSDVTDPITLVASGSRIVARTAHPEAFQTLSVLDGRRGIDKMTIDEVHTRFIGRYPVVGGLREITSPRRDVLLETDGFFALTEDEWFTPLPYRIQWYTSTADLDELGTEYILTAYAVPRRDGDYRIAEATFDSADLAKTEEGAYRFVIAAPGIEERGVEIGAASLTASFRRGPVPFAEILPRFLALFGEKEEAGAAAVVSGGHIYGEELP